MFFLYKSQEKWYNKSRKSVMKMLRETSGQQLKYELVMIDNLVPENHLLRKIDKVIDFSFINEKSRWFLKKTK